MTDASADAFTVRRAADQAFLGLEPGDREGASSFVVAPHLARPDGKFFGGGGIAVALAAIEAVTDAPSLWATAQLVGSADLHDRIEVQSDVLARGRRIQQVRVTATGPAGIVFLAVGAAAHPKPGGIGATLEVMPEVRPPSEGAVAFQDDGRSGGIGWHLAADLRRAHIVEHPDRQPGRMCLWVRLRDHPHVTAAALAFLADVVPVSVVKGAGFQGAGTSLDNTLRLGELTESEWVLADVRGHQAHGGYGHGSAHLWAEDGTMLGTASQTARLSTFDFDPMGPLTDRAVGR